MNYATGITGKIIPVADFISRAHESARAHVFTLV